MPKAKKDQVSFYLGNKNLPVPETNFEWTPEMVEDLERARKSILHFSRFFYIVNLDEGKQPIKLYPYQKRILKALVENRFNVVLASRQIGKALALDTPIPTPNGWTTMGELKTGDKVYGSDGNACNVTQAHDILYNRDCYKVTFDNGENIIADAEHLWFTQSRKERNSKGSVKTTKQLFDTLETYGEEPNHRIPTNINGIEGIKKNLPIDPYVLGLWLGDGASDVNSITVGKRDITEIIDILKNQQTQFDKLTLKEYNTDVYTLRISVNENVQTKGLLSLLTSNNLRNNKHIPVEYMLASREQRLHLLQGLIDSDGYINKGGVCQFYNTNIPLAKQVKELTESLGYKVTYKEYIPKLYGVECEPAACITFTPIEYICRLSFKRNRLNIKPFEVQSKFRSQWHYIKNIEKVDSVPVRCITVDSSDSLYLCGKQYIPTHNTTILTIFALWMICFQDDYRVLLIANKEATAINIFKRIRLAYEMLPNFLKPGVINYAKTGLELANGSSIGISTTTSDAARGESINCLLIDEAAFIPPEFMNDFWESVFPVISSSKKSKIFMLSTPNGVGNLFYNIYTESLDGSNGWHNERVDWWEVPGRDEKWRDMTAKALGSVEAFNQEYGNEFRAAGENALDNDLMLEFEKTAPDPILASEDGCYNIYVERKHNHFYSIGVDVGDGIGRANSAIQVLDITDLTNIEQVATYANNRLDPFNFAGRLVEIAHEWGRPPLLVERNNCGAQVIDALIHTHHYESLVKYTPSMGTFTDKVDRDNRMGVYSHTNSKFNAMANLRYWMTTLRCLKLNDKETINEFKTYVKQANGVWKKQSDRYLDDRVESLIWSLFALDPKVIEQFYEVIERDGNGKPLKIQPLDWDPYRVEDTGIPSQQDLYTRYVKNKQPELSVRTPSILPGKQGNGSEIDELFEQGWKPVNFSAASGRLQGGMF